MPLLEMGSLSEEDLRERQQNRKVGSGRTAGSSVRFEEPSGELNPLDVVEAIGTPIESVSSAPLRKAIGEAQEGRFKEAIPEGIKQIGAPLRNAPTAGEIAVKAGVPEEYATPVGLGVEMFADPLAGIAKIGKGAAFLSGIAATRKGSKVLNIADFAGLRKELQARRALKAAEEAKLNKIYGIKEKEGGALIGFEEGKEAISKKKEAEHLAKMDAKVEEMILAKANAGFESFMDRLSMQKKFNADISDAYLDEGGELVIKVADLSPIKGRNMYVGTVPYFHDKTVVFSDGKKQIKAVFSDGELKIKGKPENVISAEEKFLTKQLDRELEGPKLTGSDAGVMNIEDIPEKLSDIRREKQRAQEVKNLRAFNEAIAEGKIDPMKDWDIGYSSDAYEKFGDLPMTTSAELEVAKGKRALEIAKKGGALEPETASEILSGRFMAKREGSLLPYERTLIERAAAKGKELAIQKKVRSLRETQEGMTGVEKNFINAPSDAQVVMPQINN